MDEPKNSGIDRVYARVESHGFDVLTDAEQSMLAIYWLFVEGYDGGLDQFFFNDSGRLAVSAPRGLQAIVAVGTADILQRAITLFPEGEVPTDQEARRTVLLGISDRSSEALDDLTADFFRSEEDVSELVGEYVKLNPELLPALQE
jgi:hypothetical protein